MLAKQSETIAYAGDVSPQECWDALQAHAEAQLIDVRSEPEWRFTGLPDLTELERHTHTVSWRIWPDMQINADFTNTIAARIPDKSTPLYLLCRTGARSAEAAMALTQAGYTACYNIQDGFEGDRNAEGQRGKNNGWKAAKLAWEQA
jgi:rhodanese-related sulfurtransferase